MTNPTQKQANENNRDFHNALEYYAKMLVFVDASSNGSYMNTLNIVQHRNRTESSDNLLILNIQQSSFYFNFFYFKMKLPIRTTVILSLD